MKIEKGNIDLNGILFSGQCFRSYHEDDGSYTVILSDRVINIIIEDDYFIVDSNVLDDLENVVRYYFDLDRDYDEVLSTILNKCDQLKKYITICAGYRVLNQDKFEMFITYIISQNNNVKRIMGSVDKLSRLYGKKVMFRNKEYYLFPTFLEMKNITTDELRMIGVGFRDSYIKNALMKLEEDEEFLTKIGFMETKDAMKELTSIKGIGEKVASCILLFGYGRFDTLPIDTWVRHFVSENFNIKDNVKEISRYMTEIFGSYSGIAIQYFYYVGSYEKRRKSFDK